MPFGSKKSGAKGVLDEVEKNNGFVFSRDFILPPELNTAEQIEILEKVYKKNIGYYKLSEDEKKVEIAKMENLIVKMIEKLKEYGGSIQSYIGSEGGSRENSSVVEKKSNTDYIVLKINQVLIFEPFGQVNNATFIGDVENYKLKDEIKEKGRLASVRKELLGRIFHTRTDKKLYDYENNHVLEIMKFASEYPQDFLNTVFSLMKNQDYCMLSTIDSKMPNCVNAVIKNISNQVKQRGINVKDVMEAGTDLNNEKKDDAKDDTKDDTKEKKGVEK